jgi:hypothetical protein
MVVISMLSLEYIVPLVRSRIGRKYVSLHIFGGINVARIFGFLCYVLRHVCLCSVSCVQCFLWIVHS